MIQLKVLYLMGQVSIIHSKTKKLVTDLVSKGFQGWNPWTDQDKAYSNYFSTQLNIFTKNNKTSIKIGRLEEDSSYLGMMFLDGQSSSSSYSSILTVDSDFLLMKRSQPSYH